MTDRYFNLVEEEWLPVTFLDGSVRELSLREVFRDAENIRSISSELGTMDGAILRLLLAIVYCAYREFDDEDVVEVFDFESWEDAWEDPALMYSTVEEYLDRTRDRFWLFDADSPFMQVADLETKSGKTDSIAKIIAEIPDGEPFMVMRSGEGAESVSLAEAARWLVHCQGYDTSGIKSGALGDPRVKGGKGYPIGTGWAGQLGLIWVEAENLHQTILRNLVPVDYFADLQLEYPNPAGDLAPWERTPDTSQQRGPAGAEQAPLNGIVELLTWQSRRVRLFREDDRVHSVLLAQGDKILPQHKQDFETMSTWRYSKPQSTKFKTDVYMPRMYDPSVAMWRGLESVLVGTSPKYVGRNKTEVPRYLPSAIVKWNAHLVWQHFVSEKEIVPLRGVGYEYGPQSSSYAELFDDRVLLPASLLSSTSMRRLIIDTLSSTQDVVTHISYFASNLLKATSISSSSDQATMVRDKEKQITFFILDELFRRWLVSVGSNEKEARQRWADQLRNVVRQREEELSRSVNEAVYLGNESMSLGKAQIFLRIAVSKTLRNYEGDETDEQ